MPTEKKVKILQINAANRLSTGNIMLGIAEVAREEGMEAYTASKFTKDAAKIEKERQNPWHYLIGSRIENTLTRYFAWYTDFQDVGPIIGTYMLIRKIKQIRPDIIHLHDVVGWYIDIGVFFRFLKKYNVPVVWTMHCCWGYTGRCIYYDSVGCEQWKTGCKKCLQLNSYPYSKLFDQCGWNYKRKKKLFVGINNLVIVTPSEWLKSEVEQSFLSAYPVRVINNGIDLKIFNRRDSDFRKKNSLQDKKIVLFVASAWSKRKGLEDAFELSKKLPEDYKVIIVGLSEQQKVSAPRNVIGLGLTKSAEELAEIYSTADVFVNPTYEDNYPTVNLEAQACGTPVVTYMTGGSPESVDLSLGAVVEKGNLEELILEVQRVCENVSGSNRKVENLIVKVEQSFSKQEKFKEYVQLYKELKNDEL